MNGHTAALPLDTRPRRPRGELRIVGLLVLHFALLLVALWVALYADLRAYGFGPDPEVLDVAVIVAFFGWFAAGLAAFWLAVTRRRFAFLTSLGWFFAATGAVVAICATVPAPPCASLWC